MTIALGNPDEERNKIIGEYFEKFGKMPLQLKAGSIGIYIQCGSTWSNYLSFSIGDK